MGPEEVDEGERPSCLRGLERISQFTWDGETDESRQPWPLRKCWSPGGVVTSEQPS